MGGYPYANETNENQPYALIHVYRSQVISQSVCIEIPWPFDVIDFATLPAHRFLAGKSFIFRCHVTSKEPMREHAVWENFEQNNPFFTRNKSISILISLLEHSVIPWLVTTCYHPRNFLRGLKSIQQVWLVRLNSMNNWHARLKMATYHVCSSSCICLARSLAQGSAISL